jgi:hypothetical protein
MIWPVTEVGRFHSRIAAHLLGTPFREHGTYGQDYHSITMLHNEPGIVLDHYDRAPSVVPNRLDELTQAPGFGFVESRGGFIEEKKPWWLDRCSCKLNHACHADGERPRQLSTHVAQSTTLKSDAGELTTFTLTSAARTKPDEIAEYASSSTSPLHRRKNIVLN